jgi:Zn-dependent oligopeptidase
MSKVLIGIILVMGIGSYFLYNQYETVKAENVALTFAVEEQKKTIEVIKENFERQGKALNNLTARNAEIEGEMTRYLDIFKRHNLNKLAIAKPGLIEKRVNDGTAKIFITIENDSKILDNLDDASTTDN